jgi:hypothetical protein
MLGGYIYYFDILMNIYKNKYIPNLIGKFFGYLFYYPTQLISVLNLPYLYLLN